jgi:hypothetical protein
MQREGRNRRGERGKRGKEKQGSARLTVGDPVVGDIYEGMETTSEERKISAKDFCGVISHVLEAGSISEKRQNSSD